MTTTKKVLIHSPAEFLATLDALVQYQRMLALAMKRLEDKINTEPEPFVFAPWAVDYNDMINRYMTLQEHADILADAFGDASEQFAGEQFNAEQDARQAAL